jgi:hypothetical protein
VAELPVETQIQLNGCTCGNCGALVVRVNGRPYCVFAWPAAGRPWPKRWIADAAPTRTEVNGLGNPPATSRRRTVEP